MTELIDLLRTSGLCGWLVLAVLYHFGTQGAWRRSKVGPWIMALCAVPLLTLLTGMVSMQLGSGHAVALAMRLTLMVVLNVMPLWLAVLFVRRQREIGRNDGEAEPLHEGDRGGGERGVRAVPAGDDGEQRSG
jgi:biotin transporter BioY